MLVGQLDQPEHIDACLLTQHGELIGIGDVDVPEGILRQFTEFCRHIVTDIAVPFFHKSLIQFSGHLRRFGILCSDDPVIVL